MLQEELRNAMRLCGCRTIAEIRPEHVDARFLTHHSLAPVDSLGEDTYLRLATAQRLRDDVVGTTKDQQRRPPSVRGVGSSNAFVDTGYVGSGSVAPLPFGLRPSEW